MPFVTADFELAAFRFYEDGTEAGSTAIAAQNTNINRTVNSDSVVLLRVRIQEIGGGSGAATDDWQLQFQKNGGGYSNVSTGTSGVKASNSSNLTDQGATTNRLTGGSGSFVAGLVSEDGLADNLQVTANNYTELLYVLTLVAADLADTDSLAFRVLSNGGALGLYTVTPGITVVKTAADMPPLQPEPHWELFAPQDDANLYGPILGLPVAQGTPLPNNADQVRGLAVNVSGHNGIGGTGQRILYNLHGKCIDPNIADTLAGPRIALHSSSGKPIYGWTDARCKGTTFDPDKVYFGVPAGVKNGVPVLVSWCENCESCHTLPGVLDVAVYVAEWDETFDFVVYKGVGPSYPPEFYFTPYPVSSYTPGHDPVCIGGGANILRLLTGACYQDHHGPGFPITSWEFAVVISGSTPIGGNIPTLGAANVSMTIVDNDPFLATGTGTFVGQSAECAPNITNRDVEITITEHTP